MITVKKLKENIYWLGEFYHFEKVISYLIIWKEKALLFDTGMGIFDMKNEIEKITSLPISVINSHSHFDHIWWNNLFDEVWIYDNDSMKEISLNWVSKEIINVNYIDSKFFNKPDFFNLDSFVISWFRYSKLLKDWDKIDLGLYKLTVVHTPGHSIDHICLYEENNWYLFSGDLIYNWWIYIENYLDYANSIKKIGNLEIKFIFPGHNDFIVNNDLIKANI